MELPINIIPSENKPKDKRLERMKYRETLPVHPANICILGRCGSGKSCCLYSMLKEGYVTDKGKSVFDEMLIFLGTMDAVDAFRKLPCDNIAIMNDFDPETFQMYLEDLKKHQMERLNKGKPPLNICVVFDDMAAQSLNKPAQRGQASPLQHLLITSRHECNATIMYCSQLYKTSGFSTPIARNNMTHWIIYAMSRPELEKIAEEHCGHLTPDQFLCWYREVMKTKHNFIMINYKKPDEERFTEKFTGYYNPPNTHGEKALQMLEDVRSEVQDGNGDGEVHQDERDSSSEAGDDKPVKRRKKKSKA